MSIEEGERLSLYVGLITQSHRSSDHSVHTGMNTRLMEGKKMTTHGAYTLSSVPLCLL